MQTLPSGPRLIAAAPGLSKVDALHSGDPHVATRLKQGIDGVLGRGAPVLIDCCPTLGVLEIKLKRTFERRIW